MVLIPSFLIIGYATSVVPFYTGLALFSFGRLFISFLINGRLLSIGAADKTVFFAALRAHAQYDAHRYEHAQRWQEL